MSFDTLGNLFVADGANMVTRKIDTAGMVSTFARGYSGHIGVLAARDGFIYASDANLNFIRKIDSVGAVVSTWATDNPIGMAMDSSNNLYIGYYGQGNIGKINTLGVVTSFIGTLLPGYSDGCGTNAKFWFPTSVVFDGLLTDLWVKDEGTVRKVTSSGCSVTIIGSQQTALTYKDGFGTSVGISGTYFQNIVFDFSGNLLFADGNVVRKMTTTGMVATFAGVIGRSQLSAADGSGANAYIAGASGLAIDTLGQVHVADYYANVIRKISLPGACI